jgi:hypothetical protein
VTNSIASVERFKKFRNENLLHMSFQEIKSTKENIKYMEQVQTAKSIDDIKEVLYILVDSKFPCSVQDYKLIKEFLDEENMHND